MTEKHQARNDNSEQIRISVIGWLTRFLMLTTLLLTAGRVTYWQGWVFSGLSVLRLLASHIMFVNKTDLIAERANPGPGAKGWDKIIYMIYIPMLIATVIVGGLDAGRFGWTAALPWYVYAISIIVNILAHGINLWAMWINKFFSSMVRIQTERGHEVIQNGPYQFIRHPGNIGVILLQISGSLILGSIWALIPAGVIVVLVVVRTYLEDLTLQRELQGYIRYTEKVRFRFLPGIW